MLILLFSIVINVISVSSVKSHVTSLSDFSLRVFFLLMSLRFGEVVDNCVKTVRKWSFLENYFSADFHPKHRKFENEDTNKYEKQKVSGDVFHIQNWCQKYVFLNTIIFAIWTFLNIWVSHNCSVSSWNYNALERIKR